LLGAGFGALTSLPGAFIPALMAGTGRLAVNALGRTVGKLPSFGSDTIKAFIKQRGNNNPLLNGVRRAAINKIKKDIPSALKWGIGIGGLSGALSSNNPIVDEYETYKPDQT
jgi:hypothetical protein